MGLACRGLQLAFKLNWYLPVFAEYIVQYFVLFLLDQQRYVTVVFFVYLTTEFMGKGWESLFRKTLQPRIGFHLAQNTMKVFRWWSNSKKYLKKKRLQHQAPKYLIFSQNIFNFEKRTWFIIWPPPPPQPLKKKLIHRIPSCCTMGCIKKDGPGQVENWVFPRYFFCWGGVMRTGSYAPCTKPPKKFTSFCHRWQNYKILHDAENQKIICLASLTV